MINKTKNERGENNNGNHRNMKDYMRILCAKWNFLAPNIEYLEF